MFTWIRTHKKTTGALIIIALIIGSMFFRGEEPANNNFVTVGYTDVVQTVDLTGRVEPAEKVELSAEAGGKTSSINVRVGESVQAGQLLVRIDDEDLRIRLQKQQLALRLAELSLSDLEKGPKTVDRLANENALAQARDDRANAQDDMNKALADGFNGVADAFLDLPSTLADLDIILGHDYLSNNIIRSRYDDEAVDFRDAAVGAFTDAENVVDDVLDLYRAANRDSDSQTVNTLINNTYVATKQANDALKATKNLLDYVDRESAGGSQPLQLAGDQADVDDMTRTLNAHQITLLDVKNAITTSEQATRDADRAIAEAEETITDDSQPDDFDLESSRIEVEQARLDVAETQSLIDRRSVTSPIDGLVTDIKAKRGETVSAGQPVVTVISASQYQITANLPEADVAKVSVGMTADVTLDAYGNETVFAAIVSAISPAETLFEGVATYELTLQFVHADERIKSGLTADIGVNGARKDKVLAVPQRAVFTRNGDKYVQIQEGEELVDRTVQTGLRGTDGNIEITSGLTEGEQVLIFSEGN